MADDKSSIKNETENNLSRSDIYFGLLNYASENEGLIYSNTATYFAIVIPLAGIALGVGGFEIDVKIFAAVSGLLFSFVWWIVIERARRWFSYILTLTAKMETDDGYELGRSTLYKHLPENDLFIKKSPRGSSLFSIMYLMGLIFFASLIFLLISG